MNSMGIELEFTKPADEVMFKTALQRLQRNMHIVVLVSDLMTYKECVGQFPQFEYLSEVAFLSDMT